jgi:transcriptional regulator with XRE-family HTH domain
MAGLFRRITERLFSSKSTPKQTTTQAKAAVKAAGGSTKAVADQLGVSQRTVQRYMQGKRVPQGKLAEKLEELATKAQVTERGRERKARQLEAQGGAPSSVTVQVDRAYDFTINGSPALRGRPIEADLTGEEAAALARAQTEEDVKAAIQPALARYFNRGAFKQFDSQAIEFDPSGMTIR